MRVRWQDVRFDDETRLELREQLKEAPAAALGRSRVESCT